MSDHIPFEIQTEIIKSLPIKSLIRFRSVSKPWKSLIDSSEFIADYHVRHTQPQQHLLVRYTQPQHLRYTHSNNYTEDFFSLVDDDTFPRDKSHLTVPMSIKRLGETRIIGSSDQGLICFYKFYRDIDESGTAVLWNPSIRKSVVIDVPDVLDIPYHTVVGFGVCRNTSDPKLVKISYHSSPESSLPWQVGVFTLSSWAWKSIFINLPRKSISLCHKGPVVIDGVMYWLAFDKHVDFRYRSYNLVISFDLTSEEFTEICFPDKLEHAITLLMYKPTKSLAVVEYFWEDDKSVCDVWIMEHGARKSFTKLFRVKAPNYSVSPVLQFRKNGEAIIQTSNYSNESVKCNSNVMAKLEAYEPFSEHVHDLGIGINTDSGSFIDDEFFVTSYTESLLLHDHPDYIFH